MRSAGDVSDTRWEMDGWTVGGEGWKDRARGGPSSRLVVGGVGGDGGARDAFADRE